MTVIETIAKNVRMQMAKRDLTATHLAHRLKASDDAIRNKLNGRVPFSEEELEALAPYMDTSLEALRGELEVPVNGKPAEVPTVTRAKPTEKTTLPAKPVIALIALTNKNEDLRQLLLKTFMAKLTGKIDDLGYYIRNNLLMKVLRQYSDDPLSEEEKVAYVDGCKDEYERWKTGLVSDIDDITEVALSSNEVEVVSAVLMASGKGRLSQFVRALIKDHLSEGMVEMEALERDVEKVLEHFQRVKKLIDDFLAACEE